ncbi:MAG: hypothetical protein O2910_08360, partial [Proteobacteria bacterium]|nr:hypothetical protein [Pseudomonadota bacterium]
MNKFILKAALAAAMFLPVGIASAQDEEPRAITLEQVLRLVKDKTALESADETKRIRTFQNEKNQRQTLLDKARNERARLQRESERLDATFD